MSTSDSSLALWLQMIVSSCWPWACWLFVCGKTVNIAAVWWHTLLPRPSICWFMEEPPLSFMCSLLLKWFWAIFNATKAHKVGASGTKWSNRFRKKANFLFVLSGCFPTSFCRIPVSLGVFFVSWPFRTFKWLTVTHCSALAAGDKLRLSLCFEIEVVAITPQAHTSLTLLASLDPWMSFSPSLCQLPCSKGE